MFDKYNRTARVYPSVITLIPFLIFTINAEITELKTVLDNLLAIKIVGNITISIVLLFLLVQFNRILGKFFFQNYIFNNELEMPSTNFLLFNNSEFSLEYKMKIREKINFDFQIMLSDEASEREDELNARRRIVEAVGLVRQKVKKGTLLLQHNIEYGFFRNLIGGATIALLISIWDIYYFFYVGNKIVGIISIFVAACFTILILVHRFIIKRLGEQYAKRLFQEYLQE